MARVSESWISDELQEILADLTSQQAMGVLRIVQAELEGRSLSSLLDCVDQVCTSTTFYGSGKRKGWRQKPTFQNALRLARRDYRKWMLEHGVNDALTILAGTAPQAARALRQQVIGDEGAISVLSSLLGSEDPEVRMQSASKLGESGLAVAVPALKAAIVAEEDSNVRQAILAALGNIAGWRDTDRRLAAISILDRADVKTAAKQAFSVNDDDVDAAIERELERLAAESQGPDAGTSEGDPLDGEADDVSGPAELDPETPEAAGTG